MIKLLVITTLYPNQNQFRHGIFVENRVKSLVASGKTEALVIAPVPWVPAVFIWLLTAFSLTKKLAESLPLAEYKLYQSISIILANSVLLLNSQRLPTAWLLLTVYLRLMP